MANVAVQAAFKLNTGEIVDMKTTLQEGTEGELLTSTKYSVSAVSIGTFAEGKVLSQIIQPPTCLNGASYAYIDRRGEILCIIPVAVAWIHDYPLPMLSSFTLQAGDTLRVIASTSASKLFSYNAITSGGIHSIFTVTPTTANDYQVTHIKSGQGLGASLTNQQIACHFATSVQDGALDSAGGLLILSDRGLPIGGVAATNPQKLPHQKSYMGGAVIGLNFVGRVTTNA